MPKLKKLREMIDAVNPSCHLEVDGGVDLVTSKLCKENGADVLVAGSAFYKAADRAAFVQEIEIRKFDGVNMYLTHGHRHMVKQRLDMLLLDARKCKAAAALYGHTHIADCHQEEDGLWVLNPGSCGYYGGSAGLIETDKGKIVNCRILRQENLEELL